MIMMIMPFTLLSKIIWAKSLLRLGSVCMIESVSYLMLQTLRRFRQLTAHLHQSTDSS
jgi:hypothetical protein